MDLLDGAEAEHSRETPRGKGGGRCKMSWMGQGGPGCLFLFVVLRLPHPCSVLLFPLKTAFDICASPCVPELCKEGKDASPISSSVQPLLSYQVKGMGFHDSLSHSVQYKI